MLKQLIDLTLRGIRGTIRGYLDYANISPATGPRVRRGPWALLKEKLCEGYTNVLSIFPRVLCPKQDDRIASAIDTRTHRHGHDEARFHHSKKKKRKIHTDRPIITPERIEAPLCVAPWYDPLLSIGYTRSERTPNPAAAHHHGCTVCR